MHAYDSMHGCLTRSRHPATQKSHDDRSQKDLRLLGLTCGSCNSRDACRSLKHALYPLICFARVQYPVDNLSLANQTSVCNKDIRVCDRNAKLQLWFVPINFSSLCFLLNFSLFSLTLGLSLSLPSFSLSLSQHLYQPPSPHNFQPRTIPFCLSHSHGHRTSRLIKMLRERHRGRETKKEGLS